MSADNNHLLGILRATNFADHIRGIHGSVSGPVLHINFQAHELTAIEVAFELFLIFRSHADDGNVIVSVEAESAGVG